MGLVAAGVGSTEKPSQKLQKLLLSRQNPDGGWGLEPKTSDAFATGQTLYALKLAGFSETDPSLVKGMKYLVARQDGSGKWQTYRSGQGGAEKGETMWAVLGLVSVDVMSVAVKGVFDGQHVEPNMPLTIDAKDNSEGGISQIEVIVDDLPLQKACGASLAYTWDTKGLSDGKHVLDVKATNLQGKTSTRSYEVYAGKVFLTQVGARFDPSAFKTELSWRNISPTATGSVTLDVLQPKGDDTSHGDKVFHASPALQQGANTYVWDGKGDGGKALPKGRYLAKLTFNDDQGKPVQTESVVFFHDTEEAQRQSFGEVEGKLSNKGANAANALVELVDERGNVVQSIRSTNEGSYRFKNVSGGKYKVRATKEGFKPLEADAATAPAAAPAKADLGW